MLTGNFKYDGEGNKRREMGVPCTHPTTGATTCNMWFDYNHKNERVFSYADNISEGRQFVYDENSHLIGEYRNSDQAQIVEYIWLGDIPIAAEMANDRLIYILTDHRGSPIRGYDATTKANVWSLDAGPFGESAATVSVSGVEINLRFPGMYYDKQTGLYYNHHRYYNPKWGRYMEPDPIGLEGGLNPFVYSNNDPINKVDPSGLGWKKLKLIGSLFDDILAPLGREAVKRLSQNSSKEAAKQTTSNQAKNAATSNQAKSTAAKEGDANIVHVQNKSIEKGIRSLEKRIVEHENKLNDFKSNPTVRPGMEGQPVSVIKAAQEARIRHLEKEIQTFKENIKKLQESK
ncbi:RHS repeat domain-containing protein [Acinetobacter baumannii]|nr:RHS repeat-associated core domain-containing protein [Acinetobacter baumannii]